MLEDLELKLVDLEVSADVSTKLVRHILDDVWAGEQQRGGSGGSLEPPGLHLEPPGPLLTRLHTVYMAYSERLPTRLNPLAERTCFSQVLLGLAFNGFCHGGGTSPAC